MKSPALKSASSIAVIDLGSNSVRLVVYESVTRSLVTIFNEKVLCGLGREVQSTGLLAPDAVNKALNALKRFRALYKVMKVGRVIAIATAAARDAKNGPAFIEQAERICGCKIEILTGAREAHLSALGVVSGLHKPNGIVGDLGGGSLELVEVRGNAVRKGVTTALGSLALQDASQESPKRAEKIVKTALANVAPLKALKGRTFYAVGGTWRALARLHIIHTGYPLRIMHGYSISGAQALEFVRQLRLGPGPTGVPIAGIASVAGARQPLLVYAALVLEHILLIAKPKTIVFSTYGVREGALFEMLPAADRALDGMVCAAQQLNKLHSRSALHAEELRGWTDRFFKVAKIKETVEDKRVRHIASLLSDVGWRGHPDHRGEQMVNLIANGNFGSISHQDRAFVALAVFYRYAGLNENNEVPLHLKELLTLAQVDRARILGATFRVAYLISAARPGVLPAIHFRSKERKLLLVFEHRMVDLVADRVGNRFKQLARMVGRTGSIVLT